MRRRGKTTTSDDLQKSTLHARLLIMTSACVHEFEAPTRCAALEAAVHVALSLSSEVPRPPSVR